MRILFALLAVAAGVAAASQAAANSGLSRFAGLGPVLIVNTVFVLVAAVCLWVVTGAKTTFFPAGAPWPLYLGGLCGFVIIAAGALVFPQLGAAWTIALMVFGQCVAALAIDHYGLMGMETNPVTVLRVAGVALVAGGVVVMRIGG